MAGYQYSSVTILAPTEDTVLHAGDTVDFIGESIDSAGGHCIECEEAMRWIFRDSAGGHLSVSEMYFGQAASVVPLRASASAFVRLSFVAHAGDYLYAATDSVRVTILPGTPCCLAVVLDTGETPIWAEVGPDTIVVAQGPAPQVASSVRDRFGNLCQSAAGTSWSTTDTTVLQAVPTGDSSSANLRGLQPGNCLLVASRPDLTADTVVVLVEGATSVLTAGACRAQLQAASSRKVIWTTLNGRVVSPAAVMSPTALPRGVYVRTGNGRTDRGELLVR